MFIKPLLAIMILGAGACALAQDLARYDGTTDLSGTSSGCVYYIKPYGDGGYIIEYNDGIAPDIIFPNDTMVLYRSGYYLLCGDVVNTSASALITDVIQIDVSNLVLDLNGFSVISDPASSADSANAIYIIDTVSNVTVKNGRVVAKYYGSGLYIDAGPLFAKYINAEDIDALDCDAGFSANGIALNFNRCKASGCVKGFDLTDIYNCTITDCVATSNSMVGFGLVTGSNCFIQNCLAMNNGVGSSSIGYGGFQIDLLSSTLIGNFAYNNGADGLNNYFNNVPGSVYGSVIIDNGAQVPPGSAINRLIDNVEIV